uniref:Uncharacterized protein n=1 Tax=viral metagenome TaxID=1070528 RepID=A0A6C0KSV3_9ZZZZ
MSSVQSGSSRQPARRFVSSGPFHRDIFSYTYVTNPYPEGTLAANIPGANVRTCPAGRVLRESGKKLYPVINPGVSTYMIGVIDTQSGISGFIDPNSPLFAVYSTELPAVMKDGCDPGPQGRKDVGPPLYTNGNMYVAEDGVVDGTLTASVLVADEAIIETGSFSTMTGAVLEVDEATVSSLLGGNLSVSSTESQYVLASTIESGFIQAVTGRFEQLAISTFAAVAGAVTSELYVNQLSTANIYSDYITTQQLDAGTNLEVDNLVVRSVLTASTIDVDQLTVQSIDEVSTLTVSSLYSDSIEVENAEISSLNAEFIGVSSLGVYDLEIANHLGVYECAISTLIVGNASISTLDAAGIEFSSISGDNIEVEELYASTIEFSTMSGDSIEVEELYTSSIEVSTIQANLITVSSLGVFDIEIANNLLAFNVSFSTLDAGNASISSLDVDSASISSLDAFAIEFSTISGDNIEAEYVNVSTIEFSTMSGEVADISVLTVSTLRGDLATLSCINVNDLFASTINDVREINVSEFSASTIDAAGPIVSNGQIRGVGPSGRRDPLNGAAAQIHLDIAAGPFLYIYGNGDNVVTCSNFNFCDQLFLQTSGTGTLTFSTGFGVSDIHMDKVAGMINFVCDGFHMIELGRSNWTYNF